MRVIRSVLIEGASGPKAVTLVNNIHIASVTLITLEWIIQVHRKSSQGYLMHNKSGDIRSVNISSVYKDWCQHIDCQ